MPLALNFLLYAFYAGLSFIIGTVVIKSFFKTEWFGRIQNVFLSVLFGDIVIVTLYSLFKCRLQTVNALIVLLLIALLISRQFTKKEKIVLDKLQDYTTYNWSVYLLIVVLPYFIRAIVFYNYQYHLPNIPHYDHQNYITIAETINQTGKENFFTAKTILYDQYKLAAPYRYHDIWLTSLFLEFNLPSIQVYDLIVSSFTILLSLLGLLSLFELFKKITPVAVILTCLFLFTGFAYIKVGGILIDTQNPIEYQKLGISYALFSAAILFYKKDKFLEVVFTLCLLFVFSAASLPVVLALLVLILIALIKKKVSFKTAFALTIIPVTAILGFAVFYKLFGYKDVGVSFALPGIKEFLFVVKGLIIKSFARFWFLFIWLLGAILISNAARKAVQKELSLSNVIIFVVGVCVIFQGVFVNLGDPNQFATNNTIPLLHILLFITVVACTVEMTQSKILNKLFISVMVVYMLASAYLTYVYKDSFYNQRLRVLKYSKEYLNEVDSASKNITNKLGVYWADSGYYKNSNKMKEYFIRPGEYLKIMGNNYDLVCLAPELMPDFAGKEAKYIKKNAALMIFKRDPENGSLNDTDLKIRFIAKYKIQYLVLENNFVLPEPIEKIISKKIIDSKSGEVFCLLKV